jgi:hypothetical protein
MNQNETKIEDKIEEIWKDIKGYEGLYQISNLGRIKSFRQNKEGKIRAVMKHPTGYSAVKLHKGDTHINKFVHRLLCEAFKENPNNLPLVNHIDENRSNNDLSNLEWCSYKHNSSHAIRKRRNKYTDDPMPWQDIKKMREDFSKLNITKKAFYDMNDFPISYAYFVNILNGKKRNIDGSLYYNYGLDNFKHFEGNDWREELNRVNLGFLANFISQVVTAEVDRAVSNYSELHQICKELSQFLEVSGDIHTINAVYRSPSSELRERADRMDRRDATLRKFRNVMERLNQNDTEKEVDHA